MEAFSNMSGLVKNMDRRAISWFYSVVLSAIYGLFNLYLINNGHFHEDAYILFIYVENLVNGNGITYFPGASPIEGATDFLWMIFIASLVSLGVDVGIAVIILNSVGVALISYVFFFELVILRSQKKASLLFVIFWSFIWITQSSLMASVGGFSVYLYLGLIVLAIKLLSNYKTIKYIPYISILLALYRPDGVVLGVVFTLIGFYKVNEKKSYFASMLVVAGVGIAYFLWRYEYFSNLLPLPLYVKGHGAEPNGISVNLKWILQNIHLLIMVVLFAFISGIKNTVSSLIYIVPALALFIVMSFGELSQNIGYRFQAPLYISLYYLLIVLMKEGMGGMARRGRILFNVLVFLFVVSGLVNVKKTVKSITEFNYINQFPYALGEVLGGSSVIALTEAGRMAFWNQTGHKIIDLVGLNSVYPAKNTITQEYIAGLDPDLVMFHHAGLVKVGVEQASSYGNYKKLSLDDIVVLSRAKGDFRGVPDKISKVKNASLVSIGFLLANFDLYDVYLVDYRLNGSYAHIYGIKKGLSRSVEFESALNNSFKATNSKSFFELRGY